MTLKCKCCGQVTSLSELTSSQIAADMDAHYLPAEQEMMTFSAVCGDCLEAELDDLIARAKAGAKRIKFVRAA